MGAFLNDNNGPSSLCKMIDDSNKRIDSSQTSLFVSDESETMAEEDTDEEHEGSNFEVSSPLYKVSSSKHLDCLESNKTAGNGKYGSGSFVEFRLQYLVVFAAIMLADGLQGTHLYVLYDGYGYSVPTLYAIGFLSGATTSIFMGAVVDMIGRKKAVVIYCVLEILINYMEQFPILLCLIMSRVIGGVTTNLLFTVFETWLVTEHHKRGFADAKLEIILRDSSIVSNLAAIISGYIAHHLAASLGAVGPFIGAVGFTCIALIIVCLLWCENYGTISRDIDGKRPSMREHLAIATKAILTHRDISYIGLIHGFTEGSLQTFVFLWSPMLTSLSSTSIPTVPGLDVSGDPAYGLIFGGYMLFGVAGSYAEPKLIEILTKIRSSHLKKQKNTPPSMVIKEENTDMQSVYIFCAGCYLCSSILLLVPCMIDNQSPNAFIITLISFLFYEFFVGAFSASQSLLRTEHIPNESKCSIMSMLRLMTNTAVASGVILTNHIPIAYCFGTLSIMMTAATVLQISFIKKPLKFASIDQLKSKKE